MVGGPTAGFYNMQYIIAQVLGVVVAVICIVSAQMKHKWQMMLFSASANLLNGLSFFFLGGAWTAAVLCWVAVIQTLLFAYKAYVDKPITVFEKLVFLGAILAIGIINYNFRLRTIKLSGVGNPLHSTKNLQHSLFKKNMLPLQCTEFTKTNSCI